MLVVLSRLDRNIFEVINIINQLSDSGPKMVFVRRLELSTADPRPKLLLAIRSYFAEVERDFMSARTKQGFAAAKAKAKQPGHPMERRDKELLAIRK